MNSDKLALWEEIPLGLALLAQSYVVGLWYFASIRGADWWLDLIIAIGAGLALDLIVVTTVMGRRQGRSSGWSWATSLGAFLCSSLIALDRYGWEYRSLLHVAFPLVVFLYSQHLAVPRKTALEALPERLGAAEAPDRVMQAAPAAPAQLEAVPDQTLFAPLEFVSEPSAPLVLIESHRYACPHCGNELLSKQAVGAAVKNGYCLNCKQERKRSA